MATILLRVKFNILIKFVVGFLCIVQTYFKVSTYQSDDETLRFPRLNS